MLAFTAYAIGRMYCPLLLTPLWDLGLVAYYWYTGASIVNEQLYYVTFAIAVGLNHL